MQITSPEIDNYTLYYETFVFILRVYAIMLFDYVYQCTQSSARTICTLENNYKPANERHAKRRKEKEGKGNDIRARAHIHPCIHTHIHTHNMHMLIEVPSGDVITTRKDRLRTIPEAESNQKLIRELGFI